MAALSAGAGSGIVVRAMVAADVDDALEVFAAVASEGRWIGAEADADWEERRAGWAAGIRDPTRLSLVVVAPDGTIVGNGGLELARCGVAELRMVIGLGWRGQGIGGLLLDALIDGARDWGVHKVALQVWPHNGRALALYRSRGFVVEGRLRRHYRRASGELWDAILMGLALDHKSAGSAYSDEFLLA
jgi:RimJ/RimL family protein N-acetyltransferase